MKFFFLLSKKFQIPTIDIRGKIGVKVNKITGSRIEYIPFPLKHNIEAGYIIFILHYLKSFMLK